jgi:hypothetical protein
LVLFVTGRAPAVVKLVQKHLAPLWCLNARTIFLLFVT